MDTTTAIRTWRSAGESGDHRAALAVLAKDVELISPITERFAFRGRDQVEVVLASVFSVVSGFRYVTEISEGRETLLIARARVRGVDLQEFQHLELDEDGLIHRITLAMRPLRAITALARELGPVLARAEGRPGGARRLQLAGALLDRITATGDRRLIPLAAPAPASSPAPAPGSHLIPGPHPASAPRPAEDLDEIWDLVDRAGASLGRTHRRGDPLPAGSFHQVACVVAARADGTVLLTRRSAAKEGWPSMWELPGGSVLAGETAVQGARRELSEETGLEVGTGQLELIGRHTEQNAHVDLFLARVAADADVRIDPVEVAEAAWASPDRVRELLEAGKMAGPWTGRLARLWPAVLAALPRPNR
ncbi:NUDIX hydrolase [Brachybacterium phenoliresistens]|uniref:NUDIX hydrolase n=1 Tax=Brachybacterium phenoliresistens TaxID=396014 RepID=UPI0004AEA09F|nr:NUDIX hydrolase [Brachybacterium phenoliresistens]